MRDFVFTTSRSETRIFVRNVFGDIGTKSLGLSATYVIALSLITDSQRSDNIAVNSFMC